jgi:hypothetical protein
MIEPSELPGAALPGAARWPGEPLQHRNRRVRLAICAALLTVSATVVLFLVLVVMPAADAAGGCGGG